MINLLPPQEKKALLEEENYRLVLVLGTLVLVSLVALSLILLSVEFYIKGQAQSEEILVNMEKKEFTQLQSLQEKVSLINQDLSGLDSFYQRQTRLTKLLESVSSKIIPGMYLTSLSYQGRTSQVKISGFCKDKGVLSEFRARLKQEDQFKDVCFSISNISNWVQSKNIIFNATFIWSS